MWDAIEKAFEAAFGTAIGKAGFAKELLAYLHEVEVEATSASPVALLDANFASLIKRLNEALQLARERENEARRNQRVERIIEEFAHDHPTGCIRDRASIMLRRIDAAADETHEGDIIRAGTARLRRKFDLGTDPLSLFQRPAWAR
jgi:hypothetical protein